MTSTKINDCTAVILAGGENSRYGGFHKAFLRIDNEFIIDKALSVLSTLFTDVMVVSNSEALFQSYPVKVYPDLIKDRGPIGGIHSALKNTTKKGVFVVSCDMPNLDKSLIVKAYEQYRKGDMMGVIPQHDGLLEPLFAFYRKELFPVIDQHLKISDDNGLIRFFRKQPMHYIDATNHLNAFANINCPEDLQHWAV